MCRLLGIVGLPDSGAGLPTWEHLVGAPHALRVQASRGCVLNPANPGHEDSWGIGWFDAAGRASVLRQTGSAESSASFVFASEQASRAQAGSGPAVVLLGHLRKASVGVVSTENAHPFAAGPFLVSHNGTIKDPLLETLRADLREHARYEASSDNDTAVLAAWLVLQVHGRTDHHEALAEALSELLARAETVTGDPTGAYTGLNLLIAAPEGLYALRQFSQDGDYYTLAARPLDEERNCWVVASEPTDNLPGWELLAPGLLECFRVREGRLPQPPVVVNAAKGVLA